MIGRAFYGNTNLNCLYIRTSSGVRDLTFPKALVTIWFAPLPQILLPRRLT